MTGSCGLLMDHLYNEVCGQDYDRYNYLLKYLAHMEQKPDELPGVAVIIQGAKGCGKSLFAETILGWNIFSDRSVVTADLTELFGGFNDWTEDKDMFLLREPFWGDKRLVAKMKNAITASDRVICTKGLDDKTVPNTRRFFCTSGDPFVVPATQDERRYFILRHREAKIGDHEYFADLMMQLNMGGYSKFSKLLENTPEPSEGWLAFLQAPPKLVG